MLAYMRNGDFRSETKRFNADFERCYLDLVEKNPLSYKHLFSALCLADNLGYVKIIPFPMEATDQGLAEGIAVIDVETSRAWLIALCPVRIKAPMRR